MSGYFFYPAAAPLCKPCNLVNSYPTLTTIFTIAPNDGFITTINTCSVDSTGWLVSGYTCIAGYVPLTLTSNAKTSTKLGGCYSCAGASNAAPAVNNDPTTLYDNT